MVEIIKKSHQYIYFFGLLVIVIGLPLSTAMMSIGQMILVISWIVGGNYKLKWKQFLQNKTAIIITSLFLLHLIGLIFTTDYQYALKDLRIKLPILFLPFIIATSTKISEKKFIFILLTFITAVLTSTAYSFYLYLTSNFIDIRDICVFISHIRLSLLIVLSIFILLYFIIKKKTFIIPLKIIFSLIVIWFIYFLFISESFTGISITVFLCLFIVGYFIVKLKNKWTKFLFLFILIFIPLFIFYNFNKVFKEYKELSKEKKVQIHEKTILGNLYSHDTLNKETENGYRLYVNIAEEEMKREWNKNSSLDYEGKDKKNQDLKYTIIRFLTSKGLNKDSISVHSLTKDEIAAIEKGISNTVYLNEYSLKTRILKIFWEYDNYKKYRNPTGYSVMQRIEYWKTSLGIIKDNLLFGVGTGDLNIAFEQQYKKMNSPLSKQWQLRSHNQFFSIMVGFGLFGLIWFLITLFYPFKNKWVRKDYYYLVFFIIFLISMLTEDTLESQAGLTFYIYFTCLFLFGREKYFPKSK